MHSTRSYIIYILSAFTLLLSWPTEIFAQRRGDFTREIHETYPFEPGGRISLENINGNVDITAWDRNEVKLDVYISAYSQERLDAVNIDIDARASRLYVETRYPDRWSNDWSSRDRYDRPARVDYTLTVPATVDLDKIELINGNLELKDVAGELNLSSVNGNIRAENLQGDLDISTVNGDMDLTVLQVDRSNPVKVSSVNGRIRLTIPSDSDARIKADTVHGRISNDFDLPVNRGRYVGRKLSGRIGEGAGRIDLNNVNGTISLRRANDGRTVNQVENLLKESSSRRSRSNGDRNWNDNDDGDDDDDDWNWNWNDNDDGDDDDDGDNDDDWDWNDDDDGDDDDDDWSYRSSRRHQDDFDELGTAIEDVQAFVMDIIGTTMHAIDEDVEIEHRRNVQYEKNEIKRDIEEGIREARREIKQAMREVRREVKEWKRE